MYKINFGILLFLITNAILSCQESDLSKYDRPTSSYDTLYIKHLQNIKDCNKGAFLAKRDFTNNNFYYPLIGLNERDDDFFKFAKLKYNITFFNAGCMSYEGVECYQKEMTNLLYIKYNDNILNKISNEYLDQKRGRVLLSK